MEDLLWHLQNRVVGEDTEALLQFLGKAITSYLRLASAMGLVYLHSDKRLKQTVVNFNNFIKQLEN